MKPLIPLSLLLILFTYKLSAQDLIVNTNGDSLNCLIIAVNQYNIGYSTIVDFKAKKSYINKRQVSYFQKDFYTDSIATTKRTNYSKNKWSIGFQGGISYRLIPEPENTYPVIKSHYKSMRLGGLTQMQATYSPCKNVFVGVDFSWLRSITSSTISAEIYSPYNHYMTKIEDKVSIIYVGPKVGIEVNNRFNSIHYQTSVSIGQFYYSDQAFYQTDFLLTGKTTGFSWQNSVDFKFTKHISMVASFGWCSGLLKKLTITDKSGSAEFELDEKYYEHLNRYDLSAGLRWRF